MVVIISQCIHMLNITSYILSTYNFTCQLYLKKARGKIEKKDKRNDTHELTFWDLAWLDILLFLTLDWHFDENHFLSEFRHWISRVAAEKPAPFFICDLSFVYFSLESVKICSYLCCSEFLTVVMHILHFYGSLTWWAFLLGNTFGSRIYYSWILENFLVFLWQFLSRHFLHYFLQ